MAKRKIHIQPRNPHQGNPESSQKPSDRQPLKIATKKASKATPWDGFIARWKALDRKGKLGVYIGGGLMLVLLLVLLFWKSPEPVQADPTIITEISTSQPRSESPNVNRAETPLFDFMDESLVVKEQAIFNRIQTPRYLLITNKVGTETIAEIDRLLGSPDILNSTYDGGQYLLLSQKGQEELHSFLFQVSPSEYWKVGIADSLYVQFIQQKSESKRITEARLIRGNLKSTLNVLPLALELGEKIEKALAWTVDLYHLESNARIKFIYSATFIDGKIRSIDTLHAIWLQNGQETYYAYYFEDGNRGAFYNDEALPMKTTFLRSPVKYTRISSYFGQRFHPIAQKTKVHYGTDYAAQAGAPIYAVADGEVIEARSRPHNGYFVQLKHQDGYGTFYLHMQKNSFPDHIKKGARVSQGDLIGLVGQTGDATGPHVCFHIQKSGVPIDPVKVGLPRSKPLAQQLLPAFFQHKDRLRRELDKVSLYQ